MEDKIRVYGKAMNRTAQGIINAYLVMYPHATLDDLRKAFPNSLNPGIPGKLKEMLRTVEEAKELKKTVTAVGYLDATEDVMHLADGTDVVLVSMWTKEGFENLVSHASQYGIEVAKFEKTEGGRVKGSYRLEYLNGFVPPSSTEKEQELLAKEQELRAEEEKDDTTIAGHAYVDLGLSVKWATCNVGASSPEDCGDYFAWGETSTKTSYDVDNTKTYNKRSYNYDIGGDSSLDAARANWGGTWRLPTEAEIQELIDKCDWEWTTQGGNNGYKVTGPSGQSIFLPVTGYREKSLFYNAGWSGYYWASTPKEEDDYGSFAFFLFFRDSIHNVNWDERFYGYSVRPVSEIRTDAQGSTPTTTQETQSADGKLDESNNNQETGSGVEVDDVIIKEDENGYRIDTRGVVNEDDYYDDVWKKLEAEVPLSTPDHMVVNIDFQQLGNYATSTIESHGEEKYTFFLVENVYKGDATPPDNSPTRKLYYVHITEDDDDRTNRREVNDLFYHLKGMSYKIWDKDEIIGVRVYEGEIIRPRDMPSQGGWYPDEAIFHHDYIWSALQQEGKTGFFGNNKACLRQAPPQFFEDIQGSGTPGEVNFYINGKLVDTVTVDKDYCTQPLPPQRFRRFPVNPDIWEKSMKKNEPDEENQVNISTRTISLDQLAGAARTYWNQKERGNFSQCVFAVIETDDDYAQPPCCIFNDPTNAVLNVGIRRALTYLPEDDNNLTIKLGFIDAKGHDPDSSLAALVAYRRFRDGKLFLFSWVERDSIDMLDYNGLKVNIFNYDNPESDTPTLTDTIWVEVDGDYWYI